MQIERNNKIGRQEKRKKKRREEEEEENRGEENPGEVCFFF